MPSGWFPSWFDKFTTNGFPCFWGFVGSLISRYVYYIHLSLPLGVLMNSFLLWLTMNIFYGWIIFGNGSRVFEYFEDLPIISFLTSNRSQEVIRRTAIMACIVCNIMMFYDVFIKEQQAEIPLHHGYFKMFWRTFERIFL